MAPVIQQYAADAELLARLTQELAVAWSPYAESYQQQVYREVGPYAGCCYCARRCFYRYEVALWVADKAFERDFVAAMRDTSDDLVMWKQLTQIAERAARQLLTGVEASIAKGVALCYAIQIGARLNLSAANQLKLVKNIQQLLDREGV